MRKQRGSAITLMESFRAQAGILDGPKGFSMLSSFKNTFASKQSNGLKFECHVRFDSCFNFFIKRFVFRSNVVTEF